MNREQRLQSWPVAIAPTPGGRPVLPVLIQVPRVSARSRTAGRWSPRAATRPRRRLRREVRWTAYALLALFPPALSALAYWEGRQAALLEIRGPSAEVKADPEPEPLPPRISLSIEPAPTLAPAESEAPVVIPGYLLPDDGLEEAAHAGD